ncbi:M50 family metallopeptidase [Patescibacteria group bacterium]|nr:M50 family metallopeptidase [Patescibacteria group bacterium]
MAVSILVFIIFLSILILVHECGHFFAAKRAGIWVEEFGFGLPPRIFGKKIGETIYSINLFPFGGFVKLHGENSGDTVTKPERSFSNKSKKVRAGIIVAGVVMNFLLAIVAFAISYSFTGVPKQMGNVKIVEIRKGSPAEQAGLVADDVIVELDANKITTNDELLKLLDEKRGKEVSLKIERAGETNLLDVSTTLLAEPPEGEGVLGAVIIDSEMYLPPVLLRPFYGIYYGFQEAIFWGGMVIAGFVSILRDLFGGSLPTDVAGPAGLFVITSEIAKIGILPLLNWMGIISVNLAILNIFPFPALDGGRLFFIILEKLFGRKVLPKAENWLNLISMGLLITFLLAITFREVKQISSMGFTGYLDFLSAQ